ncbi:MAG: GNAT family N-acetyltransferase [Planctomycetaceae bacterium]|jgi:GNAT superfamily N-acetyltransferase|nr:GNAT family N-acetyltransferase [Planctomycetaceae bacterium]
MSYQIYRADWETKFFGFPIGNLELSADYDAAEFEKSLQFGQEHCRLLCITLQKEGPDSLPTGDAPCVCYDRKLTFKRPVPKNVPPLDLHVKSYASSFCSPALERLAIQSGGMTRFKNDPELSAHFERLFLTWINYSVTGGLADSIWTWREEKTDVGLATIRCARRTNPTTGLKEREGRIGMFAVDEKYRRRGIGSQLFDACDFWCSSLDIPVNSIITQKDNAAMISLCTKIGFQVKHEETVYHYWSPNWLYDTRRGWCRQRNVI